MTREEMIKAHLMAEHNIDGIHEGAFFDNGFYNGFHYGAEWAEKHPSTEHILNIIEIAKECEHMEWNKAIDVIKERLKK